MTQPTPDALVVVADPLDLLWRVALAETPAAPPPFDDEDAKVSFDVGWMSAMSKIREVIYAIRAGEVGR